MTQFSFLGELINTNNHLCIKSLDVRPQIFNVGSKWVDMEEG